MINNLSKRITERLLLNGTINQEDQELYIYGFFMLISQLVYLIFVILLGLILGCAVESIIFFAAFRFIRKYAGGYHASTEARCEIMSSLSIAVSLAIIKLSKIYDFHTVIFAAALIAAVLIFILCPLDTDEKPLSEKEFRHFRKISWIVLFIITAVIIASYFMGRYMLVPACLSLILEGILLTAGKIKKLCKKSSLK